MSEINSVVAIYETHSQVEEAVKELQKSGFDIKKMSIVGRDYQTDEHVVGYYNAGDRMKYWGKMGAFWGGIWGLLFGAAFFVIPGIGPIIVAGPLVAWIVGALEGAVVVGGLSALGAGLYSIGIPRTASWNTRLRSSRTISCWLLMAPRKKWRKRGTSCTQHTPRRSVYTPLNWSTPVLAAPSRSISYPVVDRIAIRIILSGRLAASMQ
jgi:uncharacterized membrane protein